MLKYMELYTNALGTVKQYSGDYFTEFSETVGVTL